MVWYLSFVSGMVGNVFFGFIVDDTWTEHTTILGRAGLTGYRFSDFAGISFVPA